jgi:hypothetical protein
LKERDQYGDPGVEGENNIKMDLKDMGCSSVDWIYLAQVVLWGHIPVNTID